MVRMIYITKKWYTSKTFWLNTIIGVIAAVELIGNLKMIPLEYVALIGGLLNIVLRTHFTDTKLK